MTLPIRREHKLTDAGVAGLVIGIILIAAISAYMGSVFGSSTITEASTTISDTVYTTVTQSNVSSYTVTSPVVRIETQFMTVTLTGSNPITISGHATTKTPGTTATDVIFVSAENNATTFDAKVQNGDYSLTLPTGRYNVQIIFVSIIPGNVGGGRCIAGAILMPFDLNQQESANWQC